MPPKRKKRGGGSSGSVSKPEPETIDLLDSDDDAAPVAAGGRTGGRKSARLEKKVAAPDSAKLLVFPKAPAKESISIYYSDLRRLRPILPHPDSSNLLLNDTLVDFYVKYLTASARPACGAQLLPGLDDAARSRVHVFNAFFLKRLRALFLAKEDLTPLLKWVAHVDLFNKVRATACGAASEHAAYPKRYLPREGEDGSVRPSDWQLVAVFRILMRPRLSLHALPTNAPSLLCTTSPLLRAPTPACPLCTPSPQDLLFVPVHENALSGHWALAVICFPGLVVARRNAPPPTAPLRDGDGHAQVQVGGGGDGADAKGAPAAEAGLVPGPQVVAVDTATAPCSDDHGGSSQWGEGGEGDEGGEGGATHHSGAGASGGASGGGSGGASAGGSSGESGEGGIGSGGEDARPRAPCILFLDSWLTVQSTKALFGQLRHFLEFYWQHKYATVRFPGFDDSGKKQLPPRPTEADGHRGPLPASRVKPAATASRAAGRRRRPSAAPTAAQAAIVAAAAAKATEKAATAATAGDAEPLPNEGLPGLAATGGSSEARVKQTRRSSRSTRAADAQSVLPSDMAEAAAPIDADAPPAEEDQTAAHAAGAEVEADAHAAAVDVEADAHTAGAEVEAASTALSGAPKVAAALTVAEGPQGACATEGAVALQGAPDAEMAEPCHAHAPSGEVGCAPEAPSVDGQPSCGDAGDVVSGEGEGAEADDGEDGCDPSDDLAAGASAGSSRERGKAPEKEEDRQAPDWFSTARLPHVILRQVCDSAAPSSLAHQRPARPHHLEPALTNRGLLGWPSGPSGASACATSHLVRCRSRRTSMTVGSSCSTSSRSSRANRARTLPVSVVLLLGLSVPSRLAAMSVPSGLALRDAPVYDREALRRIGSIHVSSIGEGCHRLRALMD